MISSFGINLSDVYHLRTSKIWYKKQECILIWHQLNETFASQPMSLRAYFWPSNTEYTKNDRIHIYINYYYTSTHSLAWRYKVNQIHFKCILYRWRKSSTMYSQVVEKKITFTIKMKPYCIIRLLSFMMLAKSLWRP